MYLSVIIPTFNRQKKLAISLNRLKNQTLTQSSFEVIVVNDGSTDRTKDYLNAEEKNWPQLKVYHQENSGQAKARSRAIKKAKGQIIVIIQDDIYIEPDYLETHVKFHKDHPEINYACLGLTLWDKDNEINPYMRWLTYNGPQFAYNKLIPNQEASFWFFYTSNISLKTELLRKHDFNTSFKSYGWEDIELAFRLQQKENLKIIYKPSALAYHDHHMDESDLEKRMNGVGENARIFERLHPGHIVVPRGLKKIILHIVASIPSLILLGTVKAIIPPLGRPMYWYALSKRYFLQGLSRV